MASRATRAKSSLPNRWCSANQRCTALAQRVDDAHRDQPARAWIGVGRDVVDLEAQLAEVAMGHDFVRISVHAGVGDHAYLGSIQADAGQAHRRGYVDAFGE